MPKKKETFYIITYRDPEEEKVRTLKARTVGDSSLGISFVAISDFVFDTQALVVNPEEETRRKRLEGVKTLHLSMYLILSVQEVGKDHKGLKFEKDKSNLVVLPGNTKPQK
ncbi:DUF1820 family protein [Desulfosudis oleivorans]|uniref:DUF1820 family protein n=1 Tax=Desulfosudis oleivorans (strain DSM 6200 / JCM 39069 / Hxd3) TaxID=96561 RepID=A8ZTY7_DESOH|nr:DUF1820 family protein [Desulfosudis oleivorans]ABW67920.1 hypothetical protein Dole_2116 [Desulfosudis oleivorans Hxd3]